MSDNKHYMALYCDVPRARADELVWLLARESGIIICYRGDLDSTSSWSYVVRLFSTVLCRARFPMMDRKLCQAMGWRTQQKWWLSLPLLQGRITAWGARTQLGSFPIIEETAGAAPYEEKLL